MKEKLYNTLPFIILVIGLVATYYLWKNSIEINETHKQERLNSIERQIGSAIKERLSNYADAHYAAAGLFLSSDHVTRNDWRKFVETINLLNRYPGINGLGFAMPVNKKDSLHFLKEARKDNAPDFHITGMGHVNVANDFYIIKYIEPFEKNKQAIGFDMGSGPKRREAMDIAKDSGIITISKKVTLVQDTSTSPGFLMYVPFYQNGDIPYSLNERKEKFIGWIYAPFIARNFFRRLLKRGLAEVELLSMFQIYDGNSTKTEDLLFQTDNFDENISRNNNRRILLPIYNHNWTIILQPTPLFLKEYSTNQPWMILIGGTLLSLALFYIAYLLASTRRQALAYAEQITHELKQKHDELELKNIELERSNRDLEQFAYVASHDLKEPLRMVSAYTQLLAARYKKVLDDDGKEYINFASEGAERMGTLINDLLNYSRVGRMGTKLEPVNTNLVLKEVIQKNEIQVEETGTEIIAGNLPTIMGSYSYLYSLFQNLLSNSIKFRKDDTSPKIWINAKKINGFWEFSFKDNGIGMDPQYLDRIFVIFQRLHTREKYTGTGIGLAICKKIIEFHGGEIWAKSEPGEGTTFFFTIPEKAETQNN